MKTAEAEGVIDQVLGEYAGEACVTSSFQTDCMALVHMVARRRPGIPVLFLDTGYHFPETYAYRDRMAAEMNLNLVNLAPRLEILQDGTIRMRGETVVNGSLRIAGGALPACGDN